MPQPWLDCDQAPARTQQACRFGKAGLERLVKDDVVQDEPIKDGVKARWFQVEMAGVTDECLIGATAGNDAGNTIRISVYPYQSEGGRREEVSPGVPAAAN
jgi:hypothetical protein